MKHYIIIFFQIMGNWNVFSAVLGRMLHYYSLATSLIPLRPKNRSIRCLGNTSGAFFPTAERPPVPRAVCEVENPLFAQIFVPLFFSSIVML